MSNKLSVTIERYVETFFGEVEVEIEIEASISGGMKGSRDSLGVPMAPDDDVEIEIESATFDGREVELTDKEEESAKEKAWQAVCDGALSEY